MLFLSLLFILYSKKRRCISLLFFAFIFYYILCESSRGKTRYCGIFTIFVTLYKFQICFSQLKRATKSSIHRTWWLNLIFIKFFKFVQFYECDKILLCDSSLTYDTICIKEIINITLNIIFTKTRTNVYGLKITIIA